MQDHLGIYHTFRIEFLFALTEQTTEANKLFQGSRNELLAKGQAGQTIKATMSS